MGFVLPLILTAQGLQVSSSLTSYQKLSAIVRSRHVLIPQLAVTSVGYWAVLGGECHLTLGTVSLGPHHRFQTEQSS